MKKKCIIASFGGSGSTYLANKIKKSIKTFDVIHTHALPNDNVRLGVPVFNAITNKQEGPFSKELFVPRGTKVILILRTPSHAYESRACFNHFCHIWSGSNYFNEIVNNVKEPTLFQAEFQKSWNKYVEDGKDILNLKEYMKSWQSFFEKSVEDVFFVKYEALGFLSQEITDFLELPEKLNFSDFEPRSREVKEKTATIFLETDKIYDKMDSKAFINSLPSSDEHNGEVVFDDGLTFTLAGLTAGAGDSIDRVRKTFDLVKSIKGAKIKIPEYSNYHCREFDFFKFFNVYSLSDDFIEKPKVNLNFSKFVHHLLLEPSMLTNKVTYVLDLFDQQGFKRFGYYQKFYNVGPEFDELLTKNFFPKMVNPFENKKSYKVTVHLRRNDIIGRIFDSETDYGPIGKLGLHVRTLLKLEEIPGVLDRLEIPDGTNIEVVLVSDGIKNKKRLMKQYPDSIESILALEHELEHGQIDYANISIIERFIGNSELATFNTLRAMYFSDVVISASSVFPNLVCKLGNVKLIKVNK